ncbi:MAG: VOC family protein [Pseudomonadota bacterium]
MASMHGDFHWLELNTRDPDAAAAFYTQVMGWSIEQVPMDDGTPYGLIRNGTRLVGGIFKMDGPYLEGIPNHWFQYFAVADIEAAQKAVLAAGGEIRRPPFDVPETGRIMIVCDASGAPFGLMKPAEMGADAAETDGADGGGADGAG